MPGDDGSGRAGDAGARAASSGDDQANGGPTGNDPATGDGPGADQPPDIGDVLDELEELEDVVDTEAERAQVRETIETAIAAQPRTTFGRVIRGFDRTDAAEALIGAVLFGIPMFVESGTGEVGAFVADRPVFLAGTHAFALAVVYGILYVADIQDVRIYRPLLGIVPRRLFAVMTISFATAVALMTAWGRVDWAADPWVALCTVSVAFAPMSIGAALGDILPGS